MNVPKLKLAPPWVITYRMMTALFGPDPEIAVEYNGTSNTVTLRVESQRKAAALERLLPTHYASGDVMLLTRVVPGNKAGPLLPDDASPTETVSAAFEGNPVMVQVRQVSKGLFKNLCYCVFRKEVVQYPADNLGDVNGNVSTLYENLARELLANADGICFCTSAVGGLQGAAFDKPLGEWP